MDLQRLKEHFMEMDIRPEILPRAPVCSVIMEILDVLLPIKQMERVRRSVEMDISRVRTRPVVPQ